LETKALTETGSDTMDTTSPEMMAGGLLIVRLVIGTLMMGHATQKLFGWLGGYGLRGTGGFFEQLGFRPGVVFAAAASLGELISGLLVALGLFGPVGPALMISVMLVAMLTVHWSNGLFAATNGIEVPLLYAAVALGFALAGFGPSRSMPCWGSARCGARGSPWRSSPPEWLEPSSTSDCGGTPRRRRDRRRGLQLDLGPQLHHPVRRQPIE
jgi:putative oxidoreductase